MRFLIGNEDRWGMCSGKIPWRKEPRLALGFPGGFGGDD
jgi:hypothetical protein